MPADSKSKTSKSVASKSKSKTAVQHKGGNMLNDLQNLAVPFGILLAKKGIDAALDKKTNAAQTKTNAAQTKTNAAQTKTNAAQTKTNAAQTKTGGASKAKNLRQEMDTLSNEIEKFLKKY